MKRRDALVALGATASGGCLRLTQDAPVSDTTPTPEPSTGGSSSILEGSRTKAIDAASELATMTGEPPGEFDTSPARSIQFSHSSAGSSMGGSEDAVTISPSMNIEPVGERLTFSGEHTLRVRNVSTGSSITFEPDPESGSYETDRLRVNVDSDGSLEESFDVFTPDRSGTVVEPPGEFSGDEDLFTEQLFARYAAELIDADGDVIGTTSSRIFGFGYTFRVAQTAESAFITRQPAVDGDWRAEFELGNRGSEMVGSQMLDHTGDEQVFEIDLTAFDAEPGIYEWSLTLFEDDGDERMGGLIRLIAHRNQVILIE